MFGLCAADSVFAAAGFAILARFRGFDAAGVIALLAGLFRFHAALRFLCRFGKTVTEGQAEGEEGAQTQSSHSLIWG